jgi:hypothetical protein
MPGTYLILSWSDDGATGKVEYYFGTWSAYVVAVQADAKRW